VTFHIDVGLISHLLLTQLLYGGQMSQMSPFVPQAWSEVPTSHLLFLQQPLQLEEEQ
jgi:hypothetical protein